MFEIKDYHKNVFIEGNILFDTNQEVSYLDLVCYSNLKKDQFKEVIIADKSLKKNGKTFNYVNNDIICHDDAIYHISGGVSSYGKEKVRINPYRCIFSYNYNVYGMSELFNKNKSIDEACTIDTSAYHPYRNFSLSKIIHRMIFLSVFSNYELFMMEMLIACYSRFPKVKEMFHNRVRFNGLSEEKVIEKLKTYQYNNFDEVENLFSTLLEIKIPDCTYLKRAYEKRNDIAHRYNFSKDGKIIEISKDQLENHVRNTNKFVYELFDKVIDAVY